MQMMQGPIFPLRSVLTHWRLALTQESIIVRSKKPSLSN